MTSVLDLFSLTALSVGFFFFSSSSYIECNNFYFTKKHLGLVWTGEESSICPGSLFSCFIFKKNVSDPFPHWTGLPSLPSYCCLLYILLVAQRALLYLLFSHHEVLTSYIKVTIQSSLRNSMRLALYIFYCKPKSQVLSPAHKYFSVALFFAL